MFSSVCDRINPIYTAIATTVFGTAAYLTKQTDFLSREVICNVNANLILTSTGMTGCKIDFTPDIEICRVDNPFISEHCWNFGSVSQEFSVMEPILNHRVLFWSTVFLFTVTAATLAYRKFKVSETNLKTA